MIFRKKGKLIPQFVGWFEILERVGDLAYKLTLEGPYDIFHIYMLRKYIMNPSYILDYQPL